MSRWSSGLRLYPLTVATGVRLPYGIPVFSSQAVVAWEFFCLQSESELPIWSAVLIWNVDRFTACGRQKIYFLQSVLRAVLSHFAQKRKISAVNWWNYTETGKSHFCGSGEYLTVAVPKISYFKIWLSGGSKRVFFYWYSPVSCRKCRKKGCKTAKK